MVQIGPDNAKNTFEGEKSKQNFIAGEEMKVDKLDGPTDFKPQSPGPHYFTAMNPDQATLGGSKSPS